MFLAHPKLQTIFFPKPWNTLKYLHNNLPRISVKRTASKIPVTYFYPETTEVLSHVWWLNGVGQYGVHHAPRWAIPCLYELQHSHMLRKCRDICGPPLLTYFLPGFSTCRRTFSSVMWGRWQRYCTTHLITQEDRRLGPIRERAEARRKCTLQLPPGLVPSWEHECCSHDNLSRWLLIQTVKSHKHSCKSSQQIASLQTVGNTFYMDTIHSQSIKVQKETISG